MILKTRDFQELCKTILMAVDNKSSRLEIIAQNQELKVAATNGEYFVCIKNPLDTMESFKATVNAMQFLNLVSGLTTETFELTIDNNTLIIKSGKSKYKLGIIFENESMVELAPIILENVTVNMPISVDILKSIMAVNSKEIIKAKTLDTSELQKLYYITEESCFTFTNSACLNSYKLEKPVRFLASNTLVKLFKLFKEDVTFSYGFDTMANGIPASKVIFETASVYLAAIVSTEPTLLNKVQRAYTATKNFIDEHYDIRAVVQVANLSAAIERLLTFTKNSAENTNMNSVAGTLTITGSDITITDRQGNIDSVALENSSFVDHDYSMIVNLADIKLVLASCKPDEYLTINCGNHRSVVLNRGTISNLIPEGEQQ